MTRAYDVETNQDFLIFKARHPDLDMDDVVREYFREAKERRQTRKAKSLGVKKQHGAQ